jgi:hypothetical protein
MNAGRIALSPVEMAVAQDAAGIAELLREPMPGQVRMILGDYTSQCVPRVESDLRHHAVVVRDDAGRVHAHGARTVRRMWVGGEKNWVGYLHGLRRTSLLAGDGRRLGIALARLRDTRRDDELPHDLTSIMSDNHRARRVLEGGVPGAPTYHHLADYRTAVLSAKAAESFRPWGLTVRPCPVEALSEAQSLVDLNSSEYATAATVSESWLTAWRADRIVGALACTVRGGERAEIIDGYKPLLRAARPLVNLFLRCTRRPILPQPGSDLRLAYATHVTVPDGDGRVVQALLRAMAERSCAAHIVIGCGVGHALSGAVMSMPAWHFDSRLYAVGTRPGRSERPISPEAAWL